MKKEEAEKLVQESTVEGVIKRIRTMGDDVTYYAETDDGKAFTFYRYYSWVQFEVGDRVRKQGLVACERTVGFWNPHSDWKVKCAGYWSESYEVTLLKLAD